MQNDTRQSTEPTESSMMVQPHVLSPASVRVEGQQEPVGHASPPWGSSSPLYRPSACHRNPGDVNQHEQEHQDRADKNGRTQHGGVQQQFFDITHTVLMHGQHVLRGSNRDAFRSPTFCPPRLRSSRGHLLRSPARSRPQAGRHPPAAICARNSDGSVTVVQPVYHYAGIFHIGLQHFGVVSAKSPAATA